MNFLNVQYILDEKTQANHSIKATLDGAEITIPLDPANRHYAEIMRQVAAGTLTIADAD